MFEYVKEGIQGMYGPSRRTTDLTQEPILEPAQENQNNEFNDETVFFGPTPSSISVWSLVQSWLEEQGTQQEALHQNGAKAFFNKII